MSDSMILKKVVLKLLFRSDRNNIRPSSEGMMSYCVSGAIIQNLPTFIQAGISDYLSKPIDMEDIHKIVKKWIPDKISVFSNSNEP